MRGRLVRSSLLGGNQHALAGADVIRSLLADHPAHGFAAFSAVYRGGVVPVNLRRGASARRDGVVHFRRIEAPTHADDHESDLQLFAIDCQSPCNTHARRRGVAAKGPPGPLFPRSVGEGLPLSPLWGEGGVWGLQNGKLHRSAQTLKSPPPPLSLSHQGQSWGIEILPSPPPLTSRIMQRRLRMEGSRDVQRRGGDAIEQSGPSECCFAANVRRSASRVKAGAVHKGPGHEQPGLSAAGVPGPRGERPP